MLFTTTIKFHLFSFSRLNSSFIVSSQIFHIPFQPFYSGWQFSSKWGTKIQITALFESPPKSHFHHQTFNSQIILVRLHSFSFQPAQLYNLSNGEHPCTRHWVIYLSSSFPIEPNLISQLIMEIPFPCPCLVWLEASDAILSNKTWGVLCWWALRKVSSLLKGDIQE